MTETALHKEYQNKQVVITGGLGFIGSNLAHELVKMGARLKILDALVAGYGGNKINIKGIEKVVEVVNGNILDEDLVKKTLAGADYVWHLAGQVGYLDAKNKPFVDLDYNGRGTLIVLEALKEYAPDARLLFASSRLVYGPIMAIPVREDHPTNPLSLYGIHKLLGEKYIKYYAHEFGLQGVAVRIPNPYGPRQQMRHSKYSIVGWFIRQAIENETIKIFGDGRQERDYIYIDDIVQALLRLPLAGKAGESYNIGSHERVKFVDMVDTILEIAGSGKKEFVPWPENYEKNETGDYIADTTKIKSATAWEPKVDLKEGIKKTIEYYRENRASYW